MGMINKEGMNSVDQENDDLWSRIMGLAEREDISYLKATERSVKEYWKDYNLSKEP